MTDRSVSRLFYGWNPTRASSRIPQTLGPHQHLAPVVEFNPLRLTLERRPSLFLDPADGYALVWKGASSARATVQSDDDCKPRARLARRLYLGTVHSEAILAEVYAGSGIICARPTDAALTTMRWAAFCKSGLESSLCGEWRSPTGCRSQCLFLWSASLH